MRSLRALTVLRNGSRPLNKHTARQQRLLSRSLRSCDAPSTHTIKGESPEIETKATATTNIPAPRADHRRLGVSQELFTTSIYSPGSPLFLPNGARIFNKLVAFLRAQYSQFGFDEVITPNIYKKSLWEISGHWGNFADDMFLVTERTITRGDRTDEDEEHGLKPMNCPGHCLLFASKRRSFRDLPIRFADFSSLHRSEVSGALSGLTRVRRFHQDDGHIFCRPSQVSEEISRTLDFVKLTYSTFNLGPYRLALSTRPKENYIGTVEEWDNAESSLRQALDASGQVWSVSEGDGAFYGPKIDIILKDSDGKEHQTATIQLDFQLPKRFNLCYHSPAPELEQKGVTATDPEMLAKEGPVQPVMIHRAVLGSVERFMALLIEHYNGHWPFWLNPRQAVILTVTSDKPVVDYALNALRQIQGVLPGAATGRAGELNRANFAVDMDDSARTLGKKILEAKKKRYGVIIVAGGKNMEKGDSITVDFSGISDPRGIILRELCGRMSSEITPLEPEGSFTSEQLRAVEISPQSLREMLLILEREYV